MDVVYYGAEEGYLASEAKKFGAEVLHCPKSFNLFSFSRRFAGVIVERGYDIVHCHSEAWCGPILRGAKYACVPIRIGHIRINLPQGFTIQSPVLRLGRNFIVAWGRYWLLKYASHILSVSAAALDVRFPPWRVNSKFSLWTLGVDTQEFSLESARHIRRGEKPVIINVASFSPQKRHDLLLKVYAALLDRLLEAKLILVGEGRYFERCKFLAKRLRIYDRVVFLGSREDIPDLLHGADIFVSCSEAEGLPNVLLEAQASGLPVVASDIPPHREALPVIAHAFLFKHDKIKSGADNIIRILNETQLYRRLSEAGREHVCKHYDSRKNLPKLEEMYLRWVEERRRSETSSQRTGML